MQNMKRKWYQLKSPRLKAKYQFGSPIVGVYTFNEYLVVATKLDVYISTDGVSYERVRKV